MSDTKSDKSQTDPGLGAGPIAGPGFGGPSTTDPDPRLEPFRSVDRDAPTPPEHLPPLSPRAAVGAEFGPSPTPVPPEATEGLLSGLIEAENDAYFRKAKASYESGGQAVAAFEGSPHSIPRGAPTPLPEPAVMLRQSIEMDLAVSSTVATLDPSEETRRIARPVSNTTATLSHPRSRQLDKWIAFGAAAVIVATAGILGVRWLQGGGTAPKGNASANAAAAAASPTAPALPPANPTPPASPTPTAAPPVSPPPAEVHAESSVSTPTTSAPPPARPRPAASPGARPRPKDDMKRTM